MGIKITHNNNNKKKKVKVWRQQPFPKALKKKERKKEIFKHACGVF